MNILTFENINVSYPVGENLDKWMLYIETITPLVKKIVKKKDVNIWCSGSSGAILAALLAKSIKNNCLIFHVKKEGETSHHGNQFYGAAREALNIIIDDFARSGETINRISKEVKHYDFIDILILHDCWKRDWYFDTIPYNLIISSESVCEGWKELTPKLRVYEEEKEIVSF